MSSTKLLGDDYAESKQGISSYSGSEYKALSGDSATIDGLPDSVPSGNSLGTFGGVFVPCTLGIFGVILFERLGWVVGQAGLVEALSMFLLGYAVVTSTVLSLSAIASNGEMRGGGAYYLISRALGPEFGGAIGIIFYAANVVGCAVYLLGFAEAVTDAFSGLGTDNSTLFQIAVIALAVLTVICLVGAELYSKTAIAIFCGIVFSVGMALVSFMFQSDGTTTGYSKFSGTQLRENLYPHYTNGHDGMAKYSYFTVFAIMFPAVTGIMAGANMSGDLKNPGKSIPQGTLLAIGVSSIIYTLLCILIAGTTQHEVLRLESGYQIIRRVAFLGWSITVGIFMAVLSSALGSIIGAARILQALAKDDLLSFLRWFKKGSADKDEPRRAVVLTAVLVAGTLGISSNLNTMATYQTLFFLLSYAVVNFACLALTVQGSPNFRPRWRWSSWHTSLLGTILSVGVMFCTYPFQSAICIALCAALIAYVHYQAPVTTWGDVAQSIIYHQVRKYLLRLDEKKTHIKFWRPQVLLLVSDARTSYHMIQLANNVKKGGLFIIGNVIRPDDGRDLTANEMQQQWSDCRGSWVEYISHCSLKAFANVTLAPTVADGFQQMLMLSGLGAMHPNLLMMALPDRSNLHHDLSLHSRTREFANGLQDVLATFYDYGSSIGDEECMTVLSRAISFGNHVVLGSRIHALQHYLVDGHDKPSTAHHEDEGTEHDRYIDLWILPFDRFFLGDSFWDFNCLTDKDVEIANMCVLLGWILLRSRSGSWGKYTKLRMCTCVESGSHKEKATQFLSDLAYSTRVEIDSFLVVPLEKYCGDHDLTRYKSAQTVFSSSDVQSDGVHLERVNVNIPSSVSMRVQLLGRVLSSVSSFTELMVLPLPNPEDASEVHAQLSAEAHSTNHHPAQDSPTPYSAFLAALHMLTVEAPPVLFVRAAHMVVSNEI